MENIIEDLNYRGLVAQYSNEEAVKELLSTKQTLYCGFDPSASSMHLGNYVMISLLKRFQKAGHRVVALVGGATGMIGDPSGKSKERNILNRSPVFYFGTFRKTATNCRSDSSVYKGTHNGNS